MKGNYKDFLAKGNWISLRFFECTVNLEFYWHLLLKSFFQSSFFCLGKWLLCNYWRDYLVLSLYRSFTASQKWMECQKFTFPLNYNFWENLTFCISLNSPPIFVNKGLLDRYKNSKNLLLLWFLMKVKNHWVIREIQGLHYFCP